MSNRKYIDPCGVARGLNQVGERWSLLVVRELLLGPKRFIDLQRGLGDISPNVLSQRLRDLEDAGIVHKLTVHPYAVRAYELTERGRELEPVLLALAQWGSREPIPRGGALSPDALLLSLRTTFDAAAASGYAASIALALDGADYSLSLDSGTVTIARGAPVRPDLAVTASTGGLSRLIYEAATVSDVLDSGEVTLTHGSREALERLVGCFSAPRPTAGRPM